MKPLHALTAGLAGAVALTVTHQLLHKIFSVAPRMDLMGEEALTKISTDAAKTTEPTLYNITMAGDVGVNTLYYALAAIGDSSNAPARGAALGLAAGIGGVYLPKYLGLTNSYSDRTFKTRLMTVGIYTLGGLVTGLVMSKLDNN